MQFNTKELRGKYPLLLFFLITYLGFNIMLGLILIGLHWLPTLIILISVLIVLILIFSVKVNYLAESERVIKSTSPILYWLPFFKEPKTESKYYSEIISYKTGKDLNRGFETFEYLILWFKDSTKWKVTSKKDNLADYFPFRDYIINKIEDLNSSFQKQNVSSNPAKSEITPIENIKTTFSGQYTPIKRKKNIYESIWGKILALAFSAFSIFLILFFINNPEYFKTTYLFRIALIIIPGTLYVLYRTIFKK